MHFQEVVEACHDELPYLCLPYLFGKLPEEGPPLRYLCHWLCHVDAFGGEMLMKIDATGVMDGLEHCIHVGLHHLSPVLHHELHELLEGHDSQPQCINAVICQEVTEGVHYGIEFCPCRTGPPLDSVVQSWGKPLLSGTSMISGCFDAMTLFWNSPEEGSHTRVATSKTRQIMVFLVGTSAYIGSRTLIHSLTPGQFFTPTNHHPAFTISD